VYLHGVIEIGIFNVSPRCIDFPAIFDEGDAPQKLPILYRVNHILLPPCNAIGYFPASSIRVRKTRVLIIVTITT